MSAAHQSYAAFLAADQRRRGNALELGCSPPSGSGDWRVCWYEETGELTVEGIDHAAIEADDFHAGINGPVHVLGTILSRSELETLMGRWPGLERWRPQTLSRLRCLVAGRRRW